MEVTAVLIGSRGAGSSEQAMTIYYGTYELQSSSKVNFTVTPLLSPQNKTYDSSDVPLLFRMQKSAKQISYSLDGQDNVLVEGNTTLTRLPNGDHNITIYATDNSGKSFVSETLFFTVDAPPVFPTVPVAAVSAASISVVAAGLVLFTRRKHRKEGRQT